MKTFSTRMAMVWVAGSMIALAEPKPGINMVKSVAPPGLAAVLRSGMPTSVARDGKAVTFEQKKPGVLENVTGDLVTTIRYDYEEDYNALWYQVEFENRGNQPIKGLAVEPFKLVLDPDPPNTIPRIRYMTGSYHYDATYPSRAFQIVERAFMTPDHAKPVEIGGPLSKEYVQMMECAVQDGLEMSGFMVSFEWSSKWEISAKYTKTAFQEPPKDKSFAVNASLGLGDFVVHPNSTLSVPTVHMVFFEGKTWTPLENNVRRYIAERIAYTKPAQAQVNKVTYDHWFGIHSGFDKEDMMRQARRAAELGCEFFCLDAGWYGKGAFGASGKGVWNEPDPVKFPGGVKDVQELSTLCRDHKMGFGLWSYLITKNNGARPPFDLATKAGVDGAVAQLSDWIDTYDLTWFRFEMRGQGDLNYQQGWDEVLRRATEQYPSFHIECCLGGGTRFDLGNMRYCTSVWLSDHTADPDVCRFTQTGALRFWPSYMLNLAVRVHRNSGDSEATAYNVISRMPGTLSFNGDIAQWSDEATRRVRALVDKYKSIRHLQAQPVFFPLPQVHSMEDWDVVCFGDGSGEAQLMYSFRVFGSEKQPIKVPDAEGKWSLVVSSSDKVAIEESKDGFVLTQPPRSAAVWIRK